MLALAREKDALESSDEKMKALTESAKIYYDLHKSNSDLIKFGGIQENFNAAIARTRDELDAHKITAAQAKAEFDALLLFVFAA